MPRVLSCVALLSLVPAACGQTGSAATGNGESGVDAAVYTPSSLIPPPSDGFQLAMDEFTVQPGSEVYMCQTFQIPAGAQDVGQWEFRMASGSHHLLVFGFSAASVTSDHVYPCDGGGVLGITSILAATQTTSSTITYPSGVAFAITPGSYILLQSHYINAGDAPLTAAVDVNVHLVAPSTVTANAGTIFYDPTGLTIPPGAGQTLTFQVAAPQNLNLMGAGGHMHKHGIDFKAQLNPASGATPVPLFDQTSWSDPTPSAYSPPLAVNAGDTFQWTCTWNNNTGANIVYGNSAATNEMCILFAQFYPVTGGRNTLFADPVGH